MTYDISIEFLENIHLLGHGVCLQSFSSDASTQWTTPVYQNKNELNNKINLNLFHR